MSIMNSGKKANDSKGGNNKNKPGAGGSKFLKPNSKTAGAAKKVRSTGANRGS